MFKFKKNLRSSCQNNKGPVFKTQISTVSGVSTVSTVVTETMQPVPNQLKNF